MGERAALPQHGAIVADKYRIECTIGSGGMSVVFGATHLITGRPFAVKWLSPSESSDPCESTRRFIREAQVANLFTHPNVVEVYDVGETPDGSYMVMEWLKGESLEEKLEREGQLGYSETCALLIPCMQAMDEAHQAGIVHRDLKPANIFLCEATRHADIKPKVLDFGVSKLLAKEEFNPLVTQVGVVVGTPQFLAPEQLRMQPVDARTDVYAFGVMLYQVLSGRLPFPSENFAELVLDIAQGTPTPLRELVPSLPARVEHVVARAMARNPAERYPDMGSLITALERPFVALEAASSGARRLSDSSRRPASIPFVSEVTVPLETHMAVTAREQRVPSRALWLGFTLVLVLSVGMYQRWAAAANMADALAVPVAAAQPMAAAGTLSGMTPPVAAPAQLPAVVKAAAAAEQEHPTARSKHATRRVVRSAPQPTAAAPVQAPARSKQDRNPLVEMHLQ